MRISARGRRPVTTILICGLLTLLSACSSLPGGPSSNTGYGDTGIDIGSLPSPRYPQGPLQPLNPGKVRSADVASLTPPADLWERMRVGFAMPDLNNELVERNTEFYAQRPEYIARMTERSNKYLFYIVEELERRNMPTELALLPFVESAFNPQAVSSAKAAGMWQFIPSTGRSFDLTQNAFRDDRRDVLASTRAALDYLRRLYDMFGDWQLALAAYNWGEGSVQRAQARNEKQGLGLSYTELSMPAETRNYVPKLQAIKNIVANPERYGVQLPPIDNHPYFQTVDINSDIDVALAARLAEVSVEDFRSLNPSASKPLIMAAGTPQILLPWDTAITFANNLRNYEGQLASWSVWTAPQTMSAAAAAQSVGMTEAELRQANGIPARMLIRAGSTLLVERTASMGDVSGTVADAGRIALAPEAPARPQSVRYTVRRGDTLGGIASRYGVSAANLASWNRLKPSANVRVGQNLLIYPSGRAPAKATSSATPRTPARAKPAPARATSAKATAAKTTSTKAASTKTSPAKAATTKATAVKTTATNKAAATKAASAAKPPARASGTATRKKP